MPSGVSTAVGIMMTSSPGAMCGVGCPGLGVGGIGLLLGGGAFMGRAAGGTLTERFGHGVPAAGGGVREEVDVVAA